MDRLKKMVERQKEIRRLKDMRKKIIRDKEAKIMKMIKAKNELMQGIETIVEDDLLILKVRFL